MNTSLYAAKRTCKIRGAVNESYSLLNHERMSGCVLDIKASTYDLSLRNKDLLKRYSPIYHISEDISDYVFIPVPIFITEIPNKNGIAFTKSNVHMFYNDIGKEAYQTWVGKPCHVEHRDEDPTKAVGMIFDSVMRPLDGYSVPLEQCWVLWGLDRTKNLDITHKILNSSRNFFSMGARATTFDCSYCGTRFKKKAVGTTASGKTKYNMLPVCTCLTKWPRMTIVDDNLACANAVNIVGEEVSYVQDPAWVSAEATQLLETNK